MKLPSILEKTLLTLTDNGSAESKYIDDKQAIAGLSDIYIPERDTDISTSEKTDQPLSRDIADILLEAGKITKAQHEQIRDEQAKKHGLPCEAILLRTEMVSGNDILKAKAELQGLKFVNIVPEKIDRDVFSMLDIDFIETNHIMPIAIENGVLVITAISQPNMFTIETIKNKTQMDVQTVICGIEDIERTCEWFSNEKTDYCVDDIINDMTDVEVVQDKIDNFEDLEAMAGQSPVIKFVNYLISNAIKEGVSDIHIEPKDKFTKIRYRIDGVLFETMQSPASMHPAVVSRIKIMANLDISERRLPQDGKISVIVAGRGIDLRISILPTSRGEKVVIRILDSKSIMRGLDKLGMDPEVQQAFSKEIGRPHGILLVTGPTGSGKSTTLYSALKEMDGDKSNVSTVEDPVEYELGFCNQVQVNERIGFTFASALRSLLRQDPDIIMVGEIRDPETAKIAVQAALTGHLVLSTLHTNDAPSSVTRLVDIGVDPFLIAASLNAILAQRLVRKICPNCKEPYKVPENIRRFVEKLEIDPNQLYHGIGCESCRNSGYIGRLGIYELLVIDENFRNIINKDASVTNMRETFHQSKQPSLFDDGIKKVKLQLTTLEEVLRVAEMYDDIKNTKNT